MISLDVLQALGIIALALVIVFQQIFYMREIQKLVNKTMSRSYGEYKRAETMPEEGIKIMTETDPAEDLRSLQSFQM